MTNGELLNKLTTVNFHHFKIDDKYYEVVFGTVFEVIDGYIPIRVIISWIDNKKICEYLKTKV